jgi:putative hydrolase of the HAD superfamily
VHDFDAVWLDVGGVLVLPDPTVLAPLLAPYGGTIDIDRHRRAHYAAMAVKSHAGYGEHDWDVYDVAYVRSVGVGSAMVDVAARVLNACRVPDLWRWPIPESVAAVQKLHGAGVPLAVVSNAAGQVAEMLERVGICQVGDGPCVPVRCVVDSHHVGVAKPDPAIFEFAAAHFAGIDRSRIVYVGDSVTMDVHGATAAGLRPVLLDPFDDHREAPFERIASIGDLLAR